MKRKNKHEPGVFFTDPSDMDVSDGTKNTVETFVEGVHTPVGTDNLSEDYKRLVNIKYDSDKKGKRRFGI